MTRENYNKKMNKKIFFYPGAFIKVLVGISPQQKYNLLCMINTGARINEIRHIEKKDIDTERDTLTLRITKVRAKLGEKIPDPRIIAISKEFCKYLRLNINKYKIFSTTHYDFMLKQLIKKNDLENYKEFSSHNIRKTFGTWMLALGVDGFKLAQHLGHSPEMLRLKYASPDIFNLRDKQMMRDILGNLPDRLRATYQY